MENKSLTVVSVITAGLASLCCIGPLVAVGLGLGAFGAAAFFESVRPYLLAVTAGLLGAAFYLTYRKKPEENCADGVCAAAPKKPQKLALWIATVVALPLAAFPYYSGALGGEAGSNSRSQGTALAAKLASADGTAVLFDVEGMTCAGCAATLEAALQKEPGVREVDVSLENKTARMRYDREQVSLDRLLSVMRESGFEGRPRQSKAYATEVVFSVEGMTCESCAAGIQATLARRAGVEGIEVSYGEKTARVAYDPSEITEQQLVSAFQELGYTVAHKKAGQKRLKRG